MREIALALSLLVAASFAAAGTPAQERELALTSQLRCLVCQNQTIAESDAPLAIDLRKQVHDKLAQGQSNEQIIDYMVARYGDFVLYRPALKESTWLLWFGPALLLLAGIALLGRRLRKAGTDEEEPLVEEGGSLATAGRTPTLLVCAGVIAGAAALYAALGTPGAIAPARQDLSLVEAERMIEQLAQHMRQDPGNAQGWLLLARAQTATRRYGEAAEAYKHLIALTPDDPQLRAAYADVMAQSMSKEPSRK